MGDGRTFPPGVAFRSHTGHYGALSPLPAPFGRRWLGPWHGCSSLSLSSFARFSLALCHAPRHDLVETTALLQVVELIFQLFLPKFSLLWIVRSLSLLELVATRATPFCRLQIGCLASARRRSVLLQTGEHGLHRLALFAIFALFELFL